MNAQMLNRHAEFMANAKLVTDFASDLAAVEAVILLGGLARGYCDDSSDLDISVIVSDADLVRWRRDFAKLAMEIESGSGIETDIEVHSFDGFYSQKWGEVERFTFHGCRLALDRNGRVGRAIQEKLEVPRELWTRRTVECCIYLSWYACPEPPHPSIAEIWVDREDLAQAHWCLNYACELFVQLAFSLNQEFLPPAKWRLSYLRRLKWLPDGMMELLQTMMTMSSIDEENLHSRLRAAGELWPRMMERVRSVESMDLAAMQRYYVDKIVYGPGVED
ncbi:MAG: nucleotidyltransferase domain-containing protein [Methanomassiliicoccales archaeon]|nr:nucleotidyltransferase domain-containing protein [Methanomassiliicoccales archaeon]